ncbi:hypothetical protein [Paenibacillus massiliensis]|uniref:hypothetical protein n=1 Tax=Paenibacillus massiliensis TaxID=225917 RepID=UPI00048E7F31|nr:hypothetical protein [Paenibacillus massiliensis]
MDDLHLEGMRIDSLVDLLRASYFLEEWDRTLEIASKLLISGETVLRQQRGFLKSGKPYKYGERERHLVYYYGYGYMMTGIALHKKGNFQEARECIEKYSDLCWLDDGSPQAAEEISFFKLLLKVTHS